MPSSLHEDGPADVEVMMRLTELFASNFRCFSETSPLEWRLGDGMNVVVGENDAGKSAVIDAIRLVLGTRSEDFRLSPDDFHLPAAGGRATGLVIRCLFDALTPDEESTFLEWCTIAADGSISLHATLRATLAETASGARRVLAEWRSGPDGDGPAIQGALREHIRVTYLRPLRDAEGELSAGRRSRLSQILAALPSMKGQSANDFDPAGAEPATIAGIVARADHRIRENPTVKKIEDEINKEYLSELSVGGDPLQVELGIGASVSLTQVLERLELALMPPSGHSERLRRGLGLNNVLFMAAELLLLQSQSDQLPLLLIEEPEAHLHPQLQARFVEIMSERARQADKPLQIILTTHSPLLASAIPLEEITMVAGGRIYPLSKGATWLDDGDYAFLRRFLDATKANLFFAKGVLVVEGDAENLLLPALAEKAGKSLSKHGVSIVKVGHVGLFRYSRILRRRSGGSLPIPVACIADLDIPPDDASPHIKKGRKTKKDFDAAKTEKRVASLKKNDGENVRTFPSGEWTLEYDLAHAGLAKEMWQAVRMAEDVMPEDAAKEYDGWGALTPEQAAIRVYGHMLDNETSKAVVAQNLAALIVALPEDVAAFRKRLPKYLMAALNHVAPEVALDPGAAPAPAPGAAAKEPEAVKA